ncbi:MAG: Zn-ribbon domain-containing OB-fold protein [Beijerinckiaceae bacterium]
MSETTTKRAARPVPTATSMTKPFWDAARQHRLVMQYDGDGHTFRFYPRAASLASGKRNLEWREVSGRGSVYSYTVTHIPMPGFEERGPYALALVELDEGVRILANLVNVDPRDVCIGMRVRLCWEKIGDGTEYFAFEPERQQK